MNGHVGYEMIDCPVCAAVEGWADSSAIAYAAQVIEHEAAKEQELDLSALCAHAAQDHRPVDGVCVSCGEAWLEDVNLGTIPCKAYQDIAHQKNLWVMRKVWKMRAKWRAHA